MHLRLRVGHDFGRPIDSAFTLRSCKISIANRQEIKQNHTHFFNFCQIDEPPSRNKTPGNNGIPIEFYKKFWSLISDPFIYSVNECFEKGEMSVSQKQAVITLIEKKGKDRSSLENWRPISLLNVDTKIMTIVLSK